MKKTYMYKVILIISLMFTSFALQAQEAKALFNNVPETILPLLSSVNRADFIDFMESNMKAEVKNKFGGTTEMTDLTSDYIRIQMTSRSTWEMKVLPVNDSTKVVCVVNTTCGPICDSNIQFYTSDWEALPAGELLSFPVIDDYFQLTDSTKLDEYNRFRQKMDILLVKAALSKDSNTLTFTLTTPEYDDQTETDDEEKIENTDAFLHGPLVYVWESNPSTDTYRFSKKEN